MIQKFLSIADGQICWIGETLGRAGTSLKYMLSFISVLFLLLQLVDSLNKVQFVPWCQWFLLFVCDFYGIFQQKLLVLSNTFQGKRFISFHFISIVALLCIT